MHALDLFEVGQVGRHRDGLAPGLVNGGRDLFHGDLGHVDTRHHRPLARDASCQRRADSTGRSGHDGAPPRESTRPASLSS